MAGDPIIRIAMSRKKLCPVHRAFRDERVGGTGLENKK
jgi:hypothetical protein